MIRKSPIYFQRTLPKIYKKLLRKFGQQHWWPGETPFEVAVGAILTQNTSWTNAAHAVANLKKAGLLEPSELRRISSKRLARHIRSSGYFNQKTKRLKSFVKYLEGKYAGDMSRMRKMPTAQLRQELLEISGIGPETADSILLYALEKPIFVVDAYTRRFLTRHSLISPKAFYEEIQALFMNHLPLSAPLFNEYHALIVALGKNLCRTVPDCPACPLRRIGRLKL